LIATALLLLAEATAVTYCLDIVTKFFQCQLSLLSLKGR